MYYMLTIKELTALQNMLFEGTERAFFIANEEFPELPSPERRREIHKELAHLFMEAATELIDRLERVPLAA